MNNNVWCCQLHAQKIIMAAYAHALSGTIMRTMASFVHTLHDTLLGWPLHQLYLRGVWRNQPIADICAALTHYRSEFWTLHPSECASLIANQFDSWLVTAYAALYFILVAVTLHRLVNALLDTVTGRRRRND
jgi:hypothetical protein